MYVIFSLCRDIRIFILNVKTSNKFWKQIDVAIIHVYLSLAESQIIKTASFSEQTMFADKYPSIFSPQMEAVFSQRVQFWKLGNT